MIRFKRILFIFLFSVKLFSLQENTNQDTFDRWLYFKRNPKAFGYKAFLNSKPVRAMCTKIVAEDSGVFPSSLHELLQDRGFLTEVSHYLSSFATRHTAATKAELKLFLKQRLRDLADRDTLLQEILEDRSFEASLKRVWACRKDSKCKGSCFDKYQKQLKSEIMDGADSWLPENCQEQVPKTVKDNLWLTISRLVMSDTFSSMRYEDFSALFLQKRNEIQRGFYVSIKRGGVQDEYYHLEEALRMLHPDIFIPGVDSSQAIEDELVQRVQADRDVLQRLALNATSDASMRFDKGSSLQVLYVLIHGNQWKDVYRLETAATLTDAIRAKSITEQQLLESIRSKKFIGIKARADFCSQPRQIGRKQLRDADGLQRAVTKNRAE